ncbi:MAG: hypothetical protein AzoDbin1_04744 [Azoarcus sp.]|nr:hypothetical protein [Azoarcus sp.]
MRPKNIRERDTLDKRHRLCTLAHQAHLLLDAMSSQRVYLDTPCVSGQPFQPL